MLNKIIEKFSYFCAPKYISTSHITSYIIFIREREHSNHPTQWTSNIIIFKYKAKIENVFYNKSKGGGKLSNATQNNKPA